VTYARLDSICIPGSPQYDDPPAECYVNVYRYGDGLLYGPPHPTRERAATSALTDYHHLLYRIRVCVKLRRWRF
jgi:hypothetical protein